MWSPARGMVAEYVFPLLRLDGLLLAKESKAVFAYVIRLKGA